MQAERTQAFVACLSSEAYTPRGAMIAVQRAFIISMEVLQFTDAAIRHLNPRLDAVQTYVAEAIG